VLTEGAARAIALLAALSRMHSSVKGLTVRTTCQYVAGRSHY
jgi:hypothetical protein